MYQPTNSTIPQPRRNHDTSSDQITAKSNNPLQYSNLQVLCRFDRKLIIIRAANDFKNFNS